MPTDVVVFPGRNYGHDHPGLYYVRMALQRQGWRVHPVTWDDLPNDPRAWPEAVPDVARTVLDAVRPRLVVGKSLASLAMPLVAQRGLDGVWLTPLLDVPQVALAAAHLTAGSLLVGGTADPSWDGDVARAAAAACGCGVLELDGADHGFDVGRDPKASLDVVGRMVLGVERVSGPAHGASTWTEPPAEVNDLG